MSFLGWVTINNDVATCKESECLSLDHHSRIYISHPQALAQNTMTRAAHIVLTNPVLLASVIAYQPGVICEALPFLPLRLHILWATREWTSRLFDALDHADAVLRPWLTTHDISHLPRLLGALPHMQTIVPLHAVYFGRTDILDFLLDEDTTLCLHKVPALLVLAAASGSLAMFKYLQAHGLTTGSPTVVIMMAAAGHVSILHHAAETMLVDADEADDAFRHVLRSATIRGDVDVIQYILPHCTPPQLSRSMQLAARYRHGQVVALLAPTCQIDVLLTTLQDANERGHVDMAKLLAAETRRRRAMARTVDECHA
ncbi:Aste57867_21747 [Aphanomyces stellatus]|uniref:Aste57867_21747 protein n=1 Tax=Aphanomyces stellatus TaxID=120398 RepID=A0A485LJN7_9STRA|nr:hypothetical protein As57867_021678 [Aphanomyces stellatus]VFT98416.1 Aste57867_21747 [Aphanomyces stellatus]